MKLLLTNAVSILLSAGAIYIASAGMDGWGWFLFGSLFTFTYPKTLKV